MKVVEAKSLVLDLIGRDLVRLGGAIHVDARSPDSRDPGKFLLENKAARAIHYFDGWFVHIDLDWFAGGLEPPQVHGFPFHWYVFAIPRTRRYERDHYLIVDYTQVRQWVLEFEAPLGRDHRDHNNWRADLRVFVEDAERSGYFRWGDEPIEGPLLPGRAFELDNLSTLAERHLAKARVGVFGAGGESTAHRLLKLYVAGHPTDFGLSDLAKPSVEHRFATGDRVDVLFENHAPDRTVVEVEIDGEENVCVGIQQAVKYRSLAEVQSRFPLQSSRVRSLVVAYDTDYPRATELAGEYGVDLTSVDRKLVLADPV